MSNGKFNAESFYSALNTCRESKKYTWKKVAELAQISPSTLTRMAQGKRPDVDSMAALIDWSGLSADDFIEKSNNDIEQVDTVATIGTYLRADKNLDDKSADALSAIVQAAYERLRD
ncbi:helix-turn-helix domain-containing protein [Paremcibacter congregatus]|uniref:HTH cro/C1-type domain-containing protein n=1 Tax=Paremcibacter congregatus TaxID=2043170 RepID=A0A2G4YTF0_9PROT|nr:helix-turn-helix transcriptional regulator [Paremcibacter congregatus]PHZ84716.1 hypothetical protein CRD36_10545 [Paremcibacter congregatus]QDE28911.1 helix-turn-helix transcriptional regulator [Paremcibacter congregatus]